MKRYSIIVISFITAISLMGCTNQNSDNKQSSTASPSAMQAASPAMQPKSDAAMTTKPAETTKPSTTTTKPATTQPAATTTTEKQPATTTTAATTTTSGGNAANGAPLFKKNCAGCHGNTGEGNGPAASSLKPKPANFVSADYKDSKGKNPREYTDAELKDIIDNGRKGTAMPAWKKQLTADQINDLLAYVRSLAK